MQQRSTNQYGCELDLQNCLEFNYVSAKTKCQNNILSARELAPDCKFAIKLRMLNKMCLRFSPIGTVEPHKSQLRSPTGLGKSDLNGGYLHCGIQFGTEAG